MFGQAPATSPFGAPAPAPFGAPAPAPFGGGFGQPAAAPAAGGFGAPAPAPGGFGATSTFGQPAAAPSAFGAPAPAPSAFGQPAQPTAFGGAPGGFGAAPAPAFGAPAPATGGLFGGAAPAPAPFGSPAPAPAFGAKPAGGGLFGAAPAAAPAGGLFGAAPAPAPGGLFGAAPAAAPFGSPAPATPFGAPAAAPSAFGAPAPSAFGAPAAGAFGAAPAPAAGAFGQPQQTQAGSTMAPYTTTSKQDGQHQIVLQAITAMPQYEQKSFEELRLEDYLAGNKGTKGQAAPAPAGFGGFGAAPVAAPAFGQPAAAPAFGAAPAPAAGGLFGAAPAPAAAGGLFGAAPAAAPAFGQPAPAPAFGAPAAPAAGGLFGAPAAAPAFGAAPVAAFGAPAPAAGGLFGAPAVAPAAGGLFGAPAPAPAAGGLFGAPAPAAGGLFGQPAAAPAAGGLFGAPTPAKPGGLFGATPAPAAGGLFGQPAPAPVGGGLFGAPAPVAGGMMLGSTLAPAVPAAPPPSADALLAQQLAAVENQKKQLELVHAWSGNPPSGSKVVPTSQYDIDSGSDWNGGANSYAASSSALLSYRATPRSTAKIRPRGYTPNNHSPMISLGRKTGSPILSPNKYLGSSTKTLVIKPNSLAPKAKTRLLLTNGGTNGNIIPSAAALENGNYESPSKAPIPTQQLNSPTPTNGGSQPRPVDSTSPASPRVAGTPKSPAHDFYRQVVDSPNGRSPSAASPLQSETDFVPILTKAGYNVYPSIAQLEVMSEADLAAVSGFKVERPGFGSVAWDGAVDVRGVDIDAVVMIESKNVSVYDEAEESGEKPQQGSKLNRPAVITMYDIYPKEGAGSSAEAKAKLKRKIEKSTKKMGAELLSFETESGVWTFRVGHFSRYGLDDDSEDDSDDDVNATPSLAMSDDEQESLNPFEQMNELGGVSRMHAPMDEDESTSGYTDNMSASENMDQIETEEEEIQVVDDIVRAGEEAYAMMTEEVLDVRDEEAIILYDEPLADEIEEEKMLFPHEAQVKMTAPVKHALQPLVPTTHLLPSAGICSRLAEKCGLEKTTSSNIDYGMRMRRSFRVGWRPDGSFIQLKPSGTGSQTLVQSRPVIAPSSTAEKSGNRKPSASLPLLKTHHEHSVKVVENENDAPIFSLPPSISSGPESMNHAVFDALEDYCNTSSLMCPSNSATQQAVSNAFSLLISLFGGETTDESSRLRSVSTWLKGVVSDDKMRAIAAAQSLGDVYGSVFAALSGGDILRASSLSLENGNYRMSQIVNNIGIPSQPFCNNQREYWHKSGAQSFTTSDIMRIFSLASGSIDIERQMFKSGSASYDIDWRRRFGMYLWSCSHSQDQISVPSIVSQYNLDVSAGLAPQATPLYTGKPNTPMAKDQCILYQLLNTYAEADTPIADIVSPPSHTPFHHDFSASFHLAASLTALSKSKLNPHQEDLIIDAVSAQLVSEGFWEWAVYASLCLIGNGSVSREATFAKRLHAKNIVSRFYAPSVDPSAEGRRSFLQNIGIPPQWFAEANAHRCASEGDIFGMVNNLRFSVIDTIAAMEDLVIPHMLLEGKESMKKLWQLLESIRSNVSDDSVDSWIKPYGCGMIHQVLELHAQVENLSKMPRDQIEMSNIDIDHLLDVATDLESITSEAEDHIRKKSSLTFAKIPYGFTRAPHNVVCAEVDSMLSRLRMQLLAIKDGQPTHDVDNDSQLSLKSSSHLAFSVAPDGLFDSSTPMGSESILRGFCGFKA